MLSKKQILSISVSSGTQNQFVEEIFEFSDNRKPAYVCFANVHMLVMAHRSPEFKHVVNSADIVAPDGFPVAKSFQLLHNTPQERIDGTGVMKKILEQCASKNKKVFFYGGTRDMLEKASVYLQEEYTGLDIVGMYPPPFRPLTAEEKVEVVERITLTHADFIFIVLGCPKQESWMHEMTGKIPAVLLGIGGALPMLLGIQKRAPLWIQKVGFEWLYRLAQEPRRLFQRYAITNTMFLYLLVSKMLSNAFLKNPDVLKSNPTHS